MISLCSTILRPQNKFQTLSIAHKPLSCCLLTSWNSSRSLSTLRSAPATPTSYGQRPSVWLPPHSLSLLIGLLRADHHYHHLVCSVCACVLSISLPRVRIFQHHCCPSTGRISGASKTFSTSAEAAKCWREHRPNQQL